MRPEVADHHLSNSPTADGSALPCETILAVTVGVTKQRLTTVLSCFDTRICVSELGGVESGVTLVLRAGIQFARYLLLRKAVPVYVIWNGYLPTADPLH